MVKIGLDTNIFVYFFQKHPKFGSLARNVFRLLNKPSTRGVTSVVSLIELLSLKQNVSATGKLKELYFEIPNLVTQDVDQLIGFEAARIRREYGYRTPDAIQLATARAAKVDKFYTNDKRLKNFKEIRVRILKDRL